MISLVRVEAVRLSAVAWGLRRISSQLTAERIPLEQPITSDQNLRGKRKSLDNSVGLVLAFNILFFNKVAKHRLVVVVESEKKNLFVWIRFVVEQIPGPKINTNSYYGWRNI